MGRGLSLWLSHRPVRHRRRRRSDPGAHDRRGRRPAVVPPGHLYRKAHLSDPRAAEEQSAGRYRAARRVTVRVGWLIHRWLIMDSHSKDVEALRQEMHQVRTSMVDEVHDLVENARSATDWRCYWRTHPWAWCGAVAALGYLLVPARRVGKAEVRRLADLAQSATKPPPPLSRKIMAELAGMALGLAAHRRMAFLGERLESLWSSHSLHAGDSEPELNSPRKSGGGTRAPGKMRRGDDD